MSSQQCIVGDVILEKLTWLEVCLEADFFFPQLLSYTFSASVLSQS